MKNFQHLRFLILIVIASGCSTQGDSSPKSADGKGNDITISTLGGSGNVSISTDADGEISVNGLTVAYPESFVRKDLSVEDDHVRLEFEKHKLEISDGVLVLDGRSFKGVKTGDEIEIHEDGSVTINSEAVTLE